MISSRSRSVHPRVCGEQAQWGDTIESDSGSSPRVRGTVHLQAQDRPSRRFIPACAGNSIAIGIRQGSRPVHPRVCGEQREDLEVLALDLGSSPRVRGTDVTDPNLVIFDRFIPACAGNSFGVQA